MKHRERHPEFVEGCFGCKVQTLEWRIPPYMQARYANETDEVKQATLAEVRADPKRYEQGRWV